ncbi:MAG: gluconate 2-dehydrogenase gamma chain [Chloroflexi bacterium]|nr:gluconate 2-dehydrogenase gamma chain [Chloroflexota bacterium]
MKEQASNSESGAGSDLSRRNFIQRSAVVGGSLAVGSALGASGLASADAAPAGAALSAGEMTTLKAILARLLPGDDGTPGAVEANVHVYIDRQLGTAAYAEAVPLYHQSLAALNQAAHGSFAALTAKQQDRLLQRVEAGSVHGVSQAFFFVLLAHMREGMFSDPMYGGNANFAGWDLIGYPGVKFVYTAPEQAIGTKVTPAHMSIASVGGKPAR